LPGAILPPYASPTGPELSREEVFDAFMEGARTGHSQELHIEDAMLLAERMVPFGVRLGRQSLLVRADLPADLMELKEAVEAHLRSRGLRPLEPDARLGDIAALQVTGIRGGVWDLWGNEPGDARRDLERAAVGGDTIALEAAAASGGIDDSAIGMTLEDLLGEERPEEES
jgi:hypothetical protein